LADEIGRFAVVQDGGAGANNHYHQTGAQLNEAVVPDSISMSIELGEAVRDVNENKTDPIDAAFHGSPSCGIVTLFYRTGIST
jgi:DUF917 family protein